jgi:hypothetical protein
MFFDRHDAQPVEVGGLATELDRQAAPIATAPTATMHPKQASPARLTERA